MKQPFTLTKYELDNEDDSQMVPTLIGEVPAGTPCSIFGETEAVNLHKLLTADCPGAMLLRAGGYSMLDEISDGDWLIVSRALKPEPGDIVVALVNGEATLKRWSTTDRLGKKGLYLVPSNPDYKTRELTREDDVQIFAVVVRVISHKRRRSNAHRRRTAVDR